MIDTTSTSAPAGVLGRGSAAVFTYPGARMRPLNGAFAVRDGAHEPPTGRGSDQEPTRNDNTTFGLHPPRRPQS